MIGHPLSSFDGQLFKVPAKFNKRPIETFDVLEALGPKVVAYMRDWRGDDTDADTMVRSLSADILTAKLSFDQLCKAHYSQYIMMDQSVEDLFQNDPNYMLARKVQSSMWRWGVGSDVWNEVVECFDGIRDFSIPIDGFDVTLDCTTGHNERGHSREARVFLDGVFGFLLHYKGEHVMTLGFSVTAGRKVLVQQVQLKNRKGNRFLFKLPVNRLEFFLERFAVAFPKHTICIVDGAEIAETNLKSYGRGLGEADDRLARLKDRIARDFKAGGDGKLSLRDVAEDLKRYELEQAGFRAKMDHLRADKERLAALYADTGRFQRGDIVKVNGLTHYALAA